MQAPFTPTFFKQLQQLKIRTRRSFLGSRQGAHLSPRRGHGLEFADFKPYSPGDDFRHIDWGVYGRSDRLYVRQFREEQDLNVIVMLDSSRSMSIDGGAFPAGARKFELARELALALGYIALADGDSVTFSLLGQKNSAKFSGPYAINRAFRELYAASADATFNMLAEIRAAVSRQRIPGKCFFISDLLLPLEDVLDSLEFLRAKSFDITLLQVLSPNELELSLVGGELVIDAESNETLELSLDASSKRDYAHLLKQHNSAIEDYCRKANISYLLLPSSSELTQVVLYQLPEIGVIR